MKRPFSGWREGMRHYLPWFALALLVSLLLAPWAGLPLFFVACGTALFFRDFKRDIVRDDAVALSPADGVVVAVERLEETPHYEGPCLRISIFMSVFNVHVNRAPCDCRVVDVRYAPGAYKNAMNPDAGRVNESNAVWLDTAHGPVTVRQIAGAVARHIVCAAGPGACLTQGEKFGMIKFGSRVETYLSADAEALVSINQKARAGLTRLARFHENS